MAPGLAPPRTASHRVAPRRTASHGVASHGIGPHRTASHGVAPHSKLATVFATMLSAALQHVVKSTRTSCSSAPRYTEEALWLACVWCRTASLRLNKNINLNIIKLRKFKKMPKYLFFSRTPKRKIQRCLLVQTLALSRPLALARFSAFPFRPSNLGLFGTSLQTPAPEKNQR